ncbi:transcription termination factor NusA [Patescibacteria group bacterium]
MPAIVRSEFNLALNQVATERGIDPEVVIETIKAAILAAYRKDYGTDELEQIQVELNADNGEAKLIKDDKDITPPGFGRIAAQTAKQVILQRIREAEKHAVISDFQGKVGQIVSGMVLRFDGPNIVVDIGRSQAIMPSQEQNRIEKYHLNQRLTFYIEGIRETMRGSEIIVSRAHKGLVEGLFRREVPEVSQGSVEMRVIAREAGGRTKLAVHSTQSGVDPVGSCVGQKGVRVQAVISELGGSEKVDIIQWSDDEKQFIISALAPATDLEVELDEENKTAQVFVPEDQLSLAIGKDGQNVRLAAKLSGWKIDIRGKQTEGEASDTKEETESENGDTKESEKEKEPVKDKKEKKSEKKDTDNSDVKEDEGEKNEAEDEKKDKPIEDKVEEEKEKLADEQKNEASDESKTSSTE